MSRHRRPHPPAPPLPSWRPRPSAERPPLRFGATCNCNCPFGATSWPSLRLPEVDSSGYITGASALCLAGCPRSLQPLLSAPDVGGAGLRRKYGNGCYAACLGANTTALEEGPTCEEQGRPWGEGRQHARSRLRRSACGTVCRRPHTHTYMHTHKCASGTQAWRLPACMRHMHMMTLL